MTEDGEKETGDGMEAPLPTGDGRWIPGRLYLRTVGLNRILI